MLAPFKWLLFMQQHELKGQWAVDIPRHTTTEVSDLCRAYHNYWPTKHHLTTDATSQGDLDGGGIVGLFRSLHRLVHPVDQHSTIAGRVDLEPSKIAGSNIRSVCQLILSVAVP